MILCFKFKKGEMIVYCIWEEDNVGYYSELALDDTFREDYSYQSPELRTPLSKITSTGEIEQRFRLN